MKPVGMEEERLLVGKHSGSQCPRGPQAALFVEEPQRWRRRNTHFSDWGTEAWGNQGVQLGRLLLAHHGLREDAHSLPQAQGPWAPHRLLSQLLPQLPRLGVHLFTHCELSAQLCQVLPRAGESKGAE